MAIIKDKRRPGDGAGEPASSSGRVPRPDPQKKVRRIIRRFIYGRGAQPDGASTAQRQAEIEAGRARPTLDELMSGSLFYKDDFDLELREFARVVLKFRKPIISTVAGGDSGAVRQMVDSFVLSKLEELFCEITRMVEEPSGIRLTTIEEEIDHILQTSTTEQFTLVFGNHSEFLPRLEFYRACAWGREEQLRVADRCMQQIAVMNTSEHNLKLFKSALGWMKPNAVETLSPSATKRNPLSPRAIQLAGAAMLNNLHNSVGTGNIAQLFNAKADSLSSLPQPDNGGRPKLPAQNQADDDDLADEPARPALAVFTKIQLDSSRSDQKKQYEPLLNKPIPLVQPPPLAVVRKVLIAEFPHAITLIDVILRDIGMCRDQNGHEYVAFKPVLLVGDAGIGKSQLARRLGEELGLTATFFTCAGVSDGMFAGNSKHWNSSGPSVPVEAIVSSGTANPLIIMDELEKTGTRTDHGRLQDVLLTMLEQSTAAFIHDHFLSGPVNLTGICWIATANSLDGISVPLRDRFKIMQFPNPTDSHLEALAASLMCSIAAERGLDPRWIEPLNGSETAAVRGHWQTGSIRQLRRLIEAVLDARDEFMAQRRN